MEPTPENIRPWGRYDILDKGPGFKVKRITVLPKKRTSYQSHKRRSEHWTVVAGEAVVTLDGTPKRMTGEDVAYIPIGMKHRFENVGDTPAVFIEVQRGDYFGEDDIERFEDDFGRVT